MKSAEASFLIYVIVVLRRSLSFGIRLSPMSDRYCVPSQQQQCGRHDDADDVGTIRLEIHGQPGEAGPVLLGCV